MAVLFLNWSEKEIWRKISKSENVQRSWFFQKVLPLLLNRWYHLNLREIQSGTLGQTRQYCLYWQYCWNWKWNSKSTSRSGNEYFWWIPNLEMISASYFLFWKRLFRLCLLSPDINYTFIVVAWQFIRCTSEFGTYWKEY